MYAKLWEWASLTGDTQDRMEQIRQCLEKNNFRQIYSPKMQDALKKTIWEDQELEVNKQIQEEVELHLYKRVVMLCVDPENTSKLKEVIDFINDFPGQISQSTREVLENFSRKQDVWLNIFQRWTTEEVDQDQNQIKSITDDIPWQELKIFNELQRYKISEANKVFQEAKILKEDNRNKSLQRSTNESKSGAFEVLNEEEKEEEEKEKKQIVLKYEKEIDELKEGRNKLNLKIKSLEKQLEQKEKAIKEKAQLLTKNNIATKQELLKISKESELKQRKLNEEINNLKKQIVKKESSIEEWKRELKKKEQIWKNEKEEELKISSLKFEKMKKQLGNKIHQLEQNSKKQKEQFNCTVRQKQKLAIHIRTLEKEKSEISKNLTLIKEQKQNLLKEIKILTQQISGERNKLESFKNKLTETSSELEAKRKYVLGIEAKVITLTDKNSSLNSKLKEKQISISELLCKYEEASLKALNLEKELGFQQNQNTLLQSQVDDHKKLLFEKEKMLSHCSPFDKLFSQQILFDNSRGKSFLANILVKRYNQMPINSRLLCRHDQFNKTNFHKYIDNIPHLLVLFQLNNDKIIGGFSLSPFCKNAKGEDSFLFSVSAEEVFYLKPNFKQAIVYDDFFLIFGNSQLRFKSGETKIFSNLGISAGYFEMQNRSLHTFLGNGSTREIEIVNFEMFQVYFEEPPKFLKPEN